MISAHRNRGITRVLANPMQERGEGGAPPRSPKGPPGGPLDAENAPTRGMELKAAGARIAGLTRGL